MTMCQLISDLKIIRKNLRFTLVLTFVLHDLYKWLQNIK